MISKLLIAFIANLLLSIASYSQIIMVKGKPSDGKLQWSDFTGKVDKNSTFNAYTYYTFNTKILGIQYIGDAAIINGFEVILQLDGQKSWAKKDKTTDALLVHEQGHFNFGILCVREIMKNVKEAKFTKANLNNLLQSIINDASKKYNELGLLYDKETEHSSNLEQQAKWNMFFAAEMKQQ